MLQHPLGANPARILAATRARPSLEMTASVGRLVFNNVVGKLLAARGENALVDVEPNIAVSLKVLDEQGAQTQSPAAVINDGIVRMP